MSNGPTITRKSKKCGVQYQNVKRYIRYNYYLCQHRKNYKLIEKGPTILRHLIRNTILMTGYRMQGWKTRQWYFCYSIRNTAIQFTMTPIYDELRSKGARKFLLEPKLQTNPKIPTFSGHFYLTDSRVPEILLFLNSSNFWNPFTFTALQQWPVCDGMFLLQCQDSWKYSRVHQSSLESHRWHRSASIWGR